jgi:hypothetical protein
MGFALRIWHRYVRRPWRSIGWLIVLSHAAANVRRGLVDPNYLLYAEIYFLLLAVVGLVCRWGPAAMFTLGGFCVTHYWSPWGVVASSHMEAVWQDLINPAICAGIGLLFGAQLELVERMKRLS